MSGQVRTGTYAFSNIKNYIGDLWDNCDFFIHTWDCETYTDPPVASTYALENQIAPNQKYLIDKNTLNQYYSQYQPVNMVVSKGMGFSYLDHRLYSIRYSVELMNDYSKKNNVKYDLVIRTRPDIIFNLEKRKLKDDLEQVKDSKTFYFGLLQKERPIFDNNTPHIHSEFWIGTPEVITTASKFDKIMLLRHPAHIPQDHLVHMGVWLRDGIGFRLEQLNTCSTIYRYLHLDNNMSPMSDYQLLLDTYWKKINEYYQKKS